MFEGRDEAGNGFIPFFMGKCPADAQPAELARFLQVPLKSP
ncbi:hypothetical protein PDR5_15730 [Pseudomonas sp. DR 5-09]|nr:hypothetical protein PDR5_15730 [Pseudomonas sp. DR 5-09]